jgi:predicted metal-dependent hydrolase
MENIILFISAVVFLKIIIEFHFIKIKDHHESVLIKSNIDQMYYSVKNDKNKQVSADTLAILNQRIKSLLDFIKGETGDFKDSVKGLIREYTRKGGFSSTNILSQNLSDLDTSYTINKGEKIVMCLNSKDKDNKTHDINLLMFVAIHELAHIGSVDIGHTTEFKRFFVYLLDKASQGKFYKHVDYSKTPKEYCGILIDSVPK